MKIALAAVLVGLCTLVVAIPGKAGHHQPKIADKQFLQRQKDILRLFRYINQESYYKDHVEIAKSYRVQENINAYTKVDAARDFVEIYRYGLLPRGEIFSIFYQEHLKQAKALFKLFYYAKDFDTFYKTAVWARQNLNEGLFLYSFSVAVVHRPDTYGIVLPPIYEIYPYYFYSTEVIQKAQNYKQRYAGDKTPTQDTGFKGYTIQANYSGYYLNLNPEQSLSYYLEDVGISSFYYYYNLYYPFWLDGEEFNIKYDRRGEQFYYIYQQLIARYYLERLSNGFGEVDFFNWELPFKSGYYPSLRYPNGLEFPTRPNFANLQEYFYNYGQRWCFKSQYGYSYTFVNDFERRIRDALDTGYVFSQDGKRLDLFTPDGFNTFGNLIESNPDSPNYRFYGALQVFGRHLLGYSFQPLDKYKVAPSALEHFETSLRDPAFYQFYKRFILFFQKYKSYLAPYTEKELYFNGVRVEKVEFERLVTYYDYFDADLSNAVYVTPEEFESDSFQVRARQYRLNHKPFNYKVYVNADKEYKASVRVYIGPKFDKYGREYDIKENRVNFVQFDHFTYDLKSGANIIDRNSRQNYYYRSDRTSFKDLYKRVLGALNGQEEFKLDGEEAYYGFPRRYLLPKGSYGGQAYQFYVIVSPYVPYQVQGHEQKDAGDYYYPRVGTGGQYIDGYPLGYPFDRRIDYERFFVNVPNSYFYEAQIYHRNAEDINSSHSIDH